MAMFGYVEIFAAVLSLVFLFHILRRHSNRNPLFTEWPILGMLPPLLLNLWQIHEFVTQALKQEGCTGEFRGPWFTKLNYLVTSDPMSVHHMMSKNFGNYVKGPEFREIFEAFGDGIFTADSELWKYNREILHSVFKNRNFEKFLERLIQKKVKSNLIPVVDHVQKQGVEVDLQDVFNRFTFDNICFTVLGYDPNCLSIDFPKIACEKAFNEAEECIFYRQTMPRSIWKLQSWLQIGEEKKMTQACKTFNQFLHENITSKREELKTYRGQKEMEEPQLDLLTVLIRSAEEKGQAIDDKFLRDTAFNLFVAGRDTITSGLTWFFWLVATHPLVEAKILQEMKENYAEKEGERMVLGVDEVKKLVYLHAAICEALRLFPPVPFERKQAVESEMLPSGHPIYANENILISLYAMGRSEEIWGRDYSEFKPERWISKKGGIIHVPSYKFISFNAGPRTCLGKDLSFIQMKMVISSILCDYSIQVLEGHPISPSLSIVLLMKYGLKVRIARRGI
ncbi:hypothetical protein L6164_007679 [Bauhinia variegata]|uniref:Uncharacterized protein n=1 Tax=Bauhinia variegata TaxID=167791 RepID=A0ACB9PE64_BAUVA|nr:hypothetical protein L6164_007679 [Bauhinia variegata]